MLARQPFAAAEELDPGAIGQHVQRSAGTAIENLDFQGLLPAAQRGEVRHGPVHPQLFWFVWSHVQHLTAVAVR